MQIFVTFSEKLNLKDQQQMVPCVNVVCERPLRYIKIL